MKAFKRISAIVISLAMILTCFSTVTFAAVNFNDVASNNQYVKAIEDLVDKGIINGYDNGDGTFSFKPEGNITRAEFAKMIAVADAPSNYSFNATASSFTDVAKDHWACGYIEYAVNRGIINGMGDGKFAPEQNVTYAQAIKMVVCALNYGFAAEATNPWYQSYINLANQLNLTKNAMGMPDNAADRGLIAQIIYNMNNTAPAVKTGTDSTGKPIYSAGSSSKEEESKRTKTLEGIMIGVFNDTITGESEGLNKREALVYEDGDEKEDVIFNIGEYSIEDIAGYLGYEVKVTYSEDSSGDYVIEKITKTSSNETYTIADVDISSISENSIEYFDEDAKNGVDELDFSTGMYVLKNGGAIDMDNLVDELDIDCGEILFIDNDDNGKMDVAFINSYETIFVGSVTNSSGKYTVYDKFDTSKKFVFEDDNDGLVVKVMNNNSNSLTNGTLSSITASSVISIAISASNPEDIEIIVSKKTASGSTSTSEVKSIVGDYEAVKIDKTTFDVSKYYLSNLDAESFPQRLEVGDKCNIYLDFTGKIAAVNKKETSSTYGYIIKVGKKSNSMADDRYLVRMYDASGKLYTDLPVAEKGFKINGSSADGEELKAAIEDAAYEINSVKGDDVTINADQAVLVKYEISNNTLKSVSLIGDGIEIKHLSELNEDTDNTEKLVYNSSSNSFKKGSSSKFTISASTKVFIVPLDRNDSEYRVVSGTSYFTGGTSYVIDAFDASGSSPAKAVVVYGVSKSIKPGADTILVKNITDTSDDEGDPVQVLTYYKLGSDNEEEIVTKKANTLKGVVPGDVIKMLVLNGKIERIQHIFSVEEGAIKPEDVIEDGGTFGEYAEGVLRHNQGSNDYYAMFGTVTLKPGDTDGAGGENMNVSYDGDEDNNVGFRLADSTAIIKYVYDGSARSDVFEFGKTESDIMDINPEPDAASKVLVIRYSTGVIKGVIIYDELFNDSSDDE